MYTHQILREVHTLEAMPILFYTEFKLMAWNIFGFRHRISINLKNVHISLQKVSYSLEGKADCV